MIRAAVIGATVGIAVSVAVAYAYAAGWPIPILDQDFGNDFT